MLSTTLRIFYYNATCVDATLLLMMRAADDGDST